MEPLHQAPLDDGRRPPHPFWYTLLIVPFGASNGFVTVALAFLATKHGLTVEQGATLVAASMFPNVWKFFWAPVGDKTLTRKRWYLVSTGLVAATLFALSVIPLGPSTLGVLWAVILLSSVAATFVGFSVESIVAHTTPPSHRGSVSGWFQAGNLGGSGIGGGIGLWLLNNTPSPWTAGGIMAALMCACALALRFVPEVPAERSAGGVLHAVKHVSVDLWQVMKSRNGILCAVLCFVPVGTGAAGAVLAQAEVAALWGAGENEVALVQGFLTGGVSMAGCLAGGFLCSKVVNPRVGYAIFGALMAVVTAAMAFSPMTVAMFVTYNIAYAFVTGLCYAAFSAFVLDAIGAGHAATKYNGFASLANAPIWYTGLVLATAETRGGAKGLLLTESLMGVGGIALFFVAVVVVGRTRRP
ncbi:MAG: MFS transporter [Deltaproteobacteria bacterium]|nr:MFS transporter [Deltaproteobacteria bacterium]